MPGQRNPQPHAKSRTLRPVHQETHHCHLLPHAAPLVRAASLTGSKFRRVWRYNFRTNRISMLCHSMRAQKPTQLKNANRQLRWDATAAALARTNVAWVTVLHKESYCILRSASPPGQPGYHWPSTSSHSQPARRSQRKHVPRTLPQLQRIEPKLRHAVHFSKGSSLC